METKEMSWKDLARELAGLSGQAGVPGSGTREKIEYIDLDNILPETHQRPEKRHIGRTRRAPVAEALSQSEEVCRLYAEGASDPEIAQAAGCHPTTVAKWRRRTGRPANKRKKD